MNELARIRDHGRGLKAVRELCRVSGKELAAMLGVSPSYVSSLETGKNPLTETIAAKIAQALRFEPREFADLITSHDPESGLRTQELETHYRTPPPRMDYPAPPPAAPPAASASCGEMETLARWFYGKLDPSARANALGELSAAALAGDATAATAARALLLLVRSDATPNPKPS